jgi:hypothetical protein
MAPAGSGLQRRSAGGGEHPACGPGLRSWLAVPVALGYGG